MGGSATLVHYFGALLAIEMFGAAIYVGNTLGFFSSVCVSYVGHGLLTFKAPLTKKAFSKFIVLVFTNYCVSQLILFIAEDVLELHHRVSLALIVIILPVISYLLSKYWIFKK